MKFTLVLHTNSVVVVVVLCMGVSVVLGMSLNRIVSLATNAGFTDIKKVTIFQLQNELVSLLIDRWRCSTLAVLHAILE